ncbi:MAG: quinoprotein dehydrogenase-associated SoxYZ-like carrier [Alphaproteobacteria bacterium]|jgi:sulfur-oxidizing protein SoxY|nr:quinoprotein dehydrogenase-associated SoxYZ-like carrier [Alphaproteobacteria bacterium]
MLKSAAFALALAPAIALADPLGTEAWQDILDLEFDGAEVVYDDSVSLVVPESVEEAFSVPVVLDFRTAPYAVAEIALFVENNPFPQVARIFPQQPVNAIGFNIRLEQSTPIRLAAMDPDGVWHVVHQQVHVGTPGGCQAAPPRSYLALGEIKMRQFVRPDGNSRLKLKIGHPMHTGLVVNEATGEVVPAHYIDQMSVGNESGAVANMQLWASVASDPDFMFDLPEKLQSVRVSAADTEGDDFAVDAKPTTIPRGYEPGERPRHNAM